MAMRINIRSNSSKFKLVITLSPKSTPSKGVKIDPTAKSYLSLDQSNSSFISVLREQFMLKTIFSTTNIYPSEGPRVINLEWGDSHENDPVLLFAYLHMDP